LPKLSLSPGPVASEFIKAVGTGEGDEILALGPRGEGKTISALIAMAYHAKLHENAGFKLPVTWMGVTDTFNAHKEKTIESLLKPFWQGAWKLEDGNHRAIFKTNKEAVVLSLFGIEDNVALSRVRRETCCSWFEEIAPTTEGTGVPEEAVDIGITSQRISTHASVTMLTSNYPDDNHWLWRRFMPVIGRFGRNIHPEDPKRITFQIPKGDNSYITEDMRKKWAERLKDRPDLMDRLLHGKPAVIQRGQAVAIAFVGTKNVGFNEPVHVALGKLKIIEGEPLVIGQDGGHTPATTIMQEISGVINVLYSACIARGGMRQQYRHNVVPWLRKFAPWALEDPDDYILGGYDPSLPDDETDTERVDKNPIDVIRMEIGGGDWMAGPTDWESRKGAMFAAFNRSVGGEPAIQFCPVGTQGTIRALRSQWYYPTDRYGNVTSDKPKQPNHPHEDFGQSLCYGLCRLNPIHEGYEDDAENHLKDYNPIWEERL